MITCQVCEKGATHALFHQVLHKENCSNKVVQAVLGVFILTGVTFAILGATPCLPLTATAWGIGVTVASLVAFGVFRCCSSTRTDRQREAPDRGVDVPGPQSRRVHFSKPNEKNDADDGDVWRQLEEGSKIMQEAGRKRDIETRKWEESREEGRRLEESLERGKKELASLRSQVDLLDA